MLKYRKASFKQRESRNLPPEKLYRILSQMYPKRMADETYTHLTGLAPPKTDETEVGLSGLVQITETTEKCDD